jgi:hypothetical protein
MVMSPEVQLSLGQELWAFVFKEKNNDAARQHIAINVEIKRCKRRQAFKIACGGP